jgi:hypothetical protein
MTGDLEQRNPILIARNYCAFRKSSSEEFPIDRAGRCRAKMGEDGLLVIHHLSVLILPGQIQQ